MSLTGSIARTMHAGGSVQGIDFQTGIIGKTIHAIALIDPSGLLPCITFERVGILGDVVMTAYVIEAADVEGVGGDGAKFLELMGVIGGKYQCLHNDA